MLIVVQAYKRGLPTTVFALALSPVRTMRFTERTVTFDDANFNIHAPLRG